MEEITVKRRIGLLICSLILMASLALASCRGAPTVAAQIVIGTTDRITDLDPANSYDFHTWEVQFATTAGLLANDVEGNPQPALADAMPTVSADALTWTVTLRQDLKFPSGRAFTAEDVVWSIERIHRIGGDPNWFVSSFLDMDNVGVEALDEYTVAFHLVDPVGYFPSLLALPTYSPIDQTCYSADEIDSDSLCGGIGPYMIKEWVRDERLVLEANPDWPGEAPMTDTVTIRYFTEASTMRLELESEGIDVAWKTLTPADIADLQETEGVIVWEGSGANVKRYIVFTHTIPPFDNPDVRQAIAYIIDRDAITERAWQGTYTPLYSPIPDAIPGHMDVLPRMDVDAGIALLATNGYDATNPLTFDLWWTTDHYGDEEGDVASLMKEQLEATGVIVVNLQSAEWATYTDSMSECAYPVYLLGWYPDYVDPSTWTDYFALSTSADDLCSNYNNPDMDDLIIAGWAETDAAARTQIYDQIQQLWAVDLPTLEFAQGRLFAGYLENVQGVTVDALSLLRYDLVYK
jgi:peptide/nickel transport system substrate-binding protein